MAGLVLVLSLLIPPLGIPFGLYGLWKNFEKWRFYVFSIAIGIGSFAYCYIPLESTDLVRYAIAFEEAAEKPLIQAVLETGELANGGTSSLYVYNLFKWFFGRFGNYHHACAFTTFTIYCIGMYISCSIAERMQTRKEDTVFYIVLLIISLNFYGIINNIRNVFAFSLITLAVYRDCVERKRNIFTLLIYLLPCFIHTSAISIIALRFFALIRGKMRYVIFGLICVSNRLIEFLYKNLSFFNPLGSIGNNIKYIITQAYYYFIDTGSAWGLVIQKSGANRLSSIFYLLLAGIIFFMFLRFQFEQKRNNESIKYCWESVFFTYSWFNIAYILSCYWIYK